MQAATISDRILFSFGSFCSTVGKARIPIVARAARAHQQQARSCSQNSRGKSFTLNSGLNGEPISATMRIVWMVNNAAMQTNLTARLRIGMNLKARRAPIVARKKTRDRSIAETVKVRKGPGRKAVYYSLPFKSWKPGDVEKVNVTPITRLSALAVTHHLLG